MGSLRYLADNCRQCGAIYRVQHGWCRACDWTDETWGVNLSGVETHRVPRPEPADEIEQAGFGAAIATMNEGKRL
jgi:uncharacterized OB-fold protein